MKLLVRYGKSGPARFGSHRDFARCFERGLRRAAIPMAYSSGFSPHPRISYINPAPTGAASQAEYLVIGLSQIANSEEIRTRLDAAMPGGFPILEVTPFTNQQFNTSLWKVNLTGVEPARLTQAISEFQSADQVMVSRQVKAGLRTFNVKPPVHCLQSWPVMDGWSTLTMIISHTEPLIRPDDVLAGLLPSNPPDSHLVTRLVQSDKITVSLSHLTNQG